MQQLQKIDWDPLSDYNQLGCTKNAINWCAFWTRETGSRCLKCLFSKKYLSWEWFHVVTQWFSLPKSQRCTAMASCYTLSAKWFLHSAYDGLCYTIPSLEFQYDPEYVNWVKEMSSWLQNEIRRYCSFYDVNVPCHHVKKCYIIRKRILLKNSR